MLIAVTKFLLAGIPHTLHISLALLQCALRYKVNGQKIFPRPLAPAHGLDQLANHIGTALRQSGDDSVEITTPQFPLHHGLRNDPL